MPLRGIFVRGGNTIIAGLHLLMLLDVLRLLPDEANDGWCELPTVPDEASELAAVSSQLQGQGQCHDTSATQAKHCMDSSTADH